MRFGPLARGAGTRSLPFVACLLWVLPGHVVAQAPPLSPQDAEAHQMSLTLGVGCNPRRHNAMEGSESLIERDSGPMSGTAAFYHDIDGTFLVLEEYDEQYNGHCLVFSWWGGPLEPGSYRIRQLSSDVLMAEEEADDHSFFGMSAVRTQTENSVLVIESGALEIDEMAEGAPVGTFTLSGFTVEGEERTDGVTWTGSFRAIETD